MRTIGIDFESTWHRGERDAQTFGPYIYLAHDETEIYLVSISTPDFDWVGHPHDAPWYDIIGDDVEWVSHNRTFDMAAFLVVAEAIDFPLEHVPEWRCSADLAALLGVKRDLANAAKFLLEEEVDKDPRARTNGKDAETIMSGVSKEEMDAYAIKDAQLTRRIWEEWGDQMSEHERWLSMHTTYMALEGIALDVDFVEEHLTRLNQEVFELEKQLPWTAMENPKVPKKRRGECYSPTSRSGIFAYCELEGLPRPKSLAKDSPAFDAWVEEHGEAAAWAKALQQYRSADRTRNLLDNLHNRYQSWGESVIPFALKYHGASTGRWCLPGSYEVLTPYGWQRLRDWQPTTPLVSWSENGEMDWDYNASKHVFDTGGRCAGRSINTRRLNVRCTPEHKFPKLLKSGRVDKKTAEELRFSQFELPISGKLKTEPSVVLSPLDVKLMVAAQADGCLYESDKGSGWRFAFRKPRKIERMRRILDGLKIPYKFNVYCDRSTFTFNLWSAPWYLSKTFNLGLILSLSHKMREVFIDELAYWDGHCPKNSKGVEYTTTVKVNADVVTTIAHCVGRAATVSHVDGSAKGWSDRYRVFIRERDSMRIAPSAWSTDVDLKGKVYCPQTSTGFFLCRAPDGGVFVSGNSGDGGFNMQNMSRDERNGVKIRHAFIPRVGFKFVICDLSQIEARVLLWEAGDFEQLRLIAEGMDVYEAHARTTMGYKHEGALKDVDPKLRHYAKMRVLGLQYAAGAKTFREYAWKVGGLDLSMKEAKKIVSEYRKSNKAITRYWKSLKQRVIRGARRNDGDHYEELPSGRFLCYRGVKKDRGYKAETTLGGGHRYFHPGLLAENRVSAISRDIMSYAIRAIEEELDLRVVLHIHDEVVVEVPEYGAEAHRAEIESVMRRRPEWAQDLPIDCESDVRDRYDK